MTSHTIKLFILEASQFCAKVMAAMDSRQMQYSLVEVPLMSRAARRKVLPSGGYMVPEMLLTPADCEPEVVPDSAAILRRLDKLQPAEDAFYPTPEVTEADTHIGSTINALLLYFNHVSDDGWRRSIRAKLASALPPLIRSIVPYALLLGGVRAKVREEVMDTLSVGEKDINDRAMLKRLLYELERYEAAAAESDSYLFGTPKPTAADCALYAMMLRFVGDPQVAALNPCLPDLWEEEGVSALKKWYERMAKELPLVWKNS